MSFDAAFRPSPIATGAPASYAARRRHHENLLGAGGTALVYAGLAVLALWQRPSPPTMPSARPAPALAMFDIPPASHATAAERRVTRPLGYRPRLETPSRPTPPPPIVQRPAPSAASVQPAAPVQPGPQVRTDQPADTAVPASAAPATALPTSGRMAAAERAARADWQGNILAHLRPLLRYPRMAERDGQQGSALVAIGVDRQGMVRSARIVRGSGYPLLDGEALATVKRGSPLPAPTADIPGDPVSVELPIQFSLHG